MNRIKQAWLVLTGKARATELSQGVLDRVGQLAEQHDQTAEEIATAAVEDISDLYGMKAEMDAEKQAVLDAAKEVVDNA